MSLRSFFHSSSLIIYKAAGIFDLGGVELPSGQGEEENRTTTLMSSIRSDRLHQQLEKQERHDEKYRQVRRLDEER